MAKRRSATAQVQRDQLAALRLALRITAGLMACTSFSTDAQPFGDAYAQLDWLRIALAPLARRERAIRALLPAFDPQHRETLWSSPLRARRELRRLAVRARSKSPRSAP